MSEIGIAMTGMMVVRQSRRKRKRIKTTRTNAITSVSITSLRESLMETVVSKITFNCKSSGKSFFMMLMRL